MEILLWISIGWLLGVVSVWLYQVFGKPALPTIQENRKQNLDKVGSRAGGMIKPGWYGDNVDPPETFYPADDSLVDLGKTQPVRVEDEPDAASSAAWARESE